MSDRIEEAPEPGVRRAFYLQRYQDERLNRILTERSQARRAEGRDKLTQSEFLAQMVSVLSDEELEEIDRRYQAMLLLEHEMQQRAGAETLRLVAGQPSSKILRMAQALRDDAEKKRG